MNNLVKGFNIFQDDVIVRFLKKDFNDIQIKSLRDGYEFQMKERNQAINMLSNMNLMSKSDVI